MILRDCPRCGRVNVQGNVYLEKSDKTFKALETGAIALFGAVVAGPVGLLAGLAAGKKGMDALVKNRDSNGRVQYLFHCPNPNCNHEWKDWVHE